MLLPQMIGLQMDDAANMSHLKGTASDGVDPANPGACSQDGDGVLCPSIACCEIGHHRGEEDVVHEAVLNKGLRGLLAAGQVVHNTKGMQLEPCTCDLRKAKEESINTIHTEDHRSEGESTRIVISPKRTCDIHTVRREWGKKKDGGARP